MCIQLLLDPFSMTRAVCVSLCARLSYRDWFASQCDQLHVCCDVCRSPSSLHSVMAPAAYSVYLGPGRTAKSICTSGLTDNTLNIMTGYSCAVLDTGAVTCWGHNSYGALGLGDTVTRGTSSANGAAGQTVNLGDNRTAVSISCGFQSVFAVLDNGALLAWGRNSEGVWHPSCDRWVTSCMSTLSKCAWSCVLQCSHTLCWYVSPSP
jgi:hypothetical protein